MSIDLYVMCAVISRTTAILNSSKADQEQKDYVLRMSKQICKDARRRFTRNFLSMSKNSDKNVIKISESVVKYGGYGLDIIDF